MEKYGKMRLEYIHAKKPDFYREQMQEEYIAQNPLPEDKYSCVCRGINITAIDKLEIL